jgi:hypothetical protein
MQIGRGIVWLLLNHPHETLHGLALGSVAGACVYFVRDAIKHGPARKPPGQKKPRQKKPQNASSRSG